MISVTSENNYFILLTLVLLTIPYSGGYLLFHITMKTIHFGGGHVYK
jgi:hypothetical protein